MKKLIVSFLFSILVLSVYAQEVKFKGLPINGPVEEFVDGLIQQGFVDDNPNIDGYVLLKGSFSLFSNAWVLIQSSPKKNVAKVSVYSDTYTLWEEIKHDYNEIKSMLAEKYKKPYTSEFEFKYPYYDGDTFELTALKNNKLNCHAFWEIGDCTIDMKMQPNWTIVMEYVNKTASKEVDDANRTENMKDL